MQNHFLPQNTEFYQTQTISTLVVKVASRCNLKCSYCYMYEHPDQTWREQPAIMSIETIKLLAQRINEYLNNRQLKRFLIPLHGGEPTLLGATGLRDFFSIITNETKGIDTEIKFGVQTNGTLINDEIIEVLQEFEVFAGVSIDGPQEWNDVERIDKKGKGTFFQIMAGVEKLRYPSKGESIFGGFLTVANPEIEPYKLLSFFEKINAPAVDFLLPDYNHDTFPHNRYSSGVFGRWLCDLFDIWLSTESTIEIRFFKTIMKLLLGGQNGYDSIGAISQGVLIIETDGTYHGLDVLKTAYHGATYTGKSLSSDSIQDLEKLPLVMALSTKKFSVAKKCLDCHIFEFCGGGYLPQRYSSIDGFNRESVYCSDLLIIINHIRERLINDLKMIS